LTTPFYAFMIKTIQRKERRCGAFANMTKTRIFPLLLALSLLLTACGSKPQRRDATFWELFDTVTTVMAVTESQAEFDTIADTVEQELGYYHRLFDIYNDYEGLNNLKTVNDMAGISPVKVDAVLIAFLKDCVSFHELTGGRVNVAMGSVLQLWHEKRSAALDDPSSAALPDPAALQQAAEHTDIQNLVIDEENSTVYLADSQMRLDVGAIAKGWATQRLAEKLPEGVLLSVGGNVCATGPKDKDGTAWTVGVQNPESEGYLKTLQLSRGSAVTSGDYQRTYQVNGKAYHHIIDPETLYPAGYWRSVTVVCDDSALADALSTALFLLPLEEGKALLSKSGTEAMWLDKEGSLLYSDGFPV